MVNMGPTITKWGIAKNGSTLWVKPHLVNMGPTITKWGGGEITKWGTLPVSSIPGRIPQ